MSDVTYSLETYWFRWVCAVTDTDGHTEVTWHREQRDATSRWANARNRLPQAAKAAVFFYAGLAEVHDTIAPGFFLEIYDRLSRDHAEVMRWHEADEVPCRKSFRWVVTNGSTGLVAVTRSRSDAERRALASIRATLRGHEVSIFPYCTREQTPSSLLTSEVNDMVVAEVAPRTMEDTHTPVWRARRN